MNKFCLKFKKLKILIRHNLLYQAFRRVEMENQRSKKQKQKQEQERQERERQQKQRQQKQQR